MWNIMYTYNSAFNSPFIRNSLYFSVIQQQATSQINFSTSSPLLVHLCKAECYSALHAAHFALIRLCSSVDSEFHQYQKTWSWSLSTLSICSAVISGGATIWTVVLPNWYVASYFTISPHDIICLHSWCTTLVLAVLHQLDNSQAAETLY